MHRGILSRGVRAFAVVAIASAVLVSGFVSAAPVFGDRDGTNTWTIAMYWASDNNLDEYTEYFVDLWIDHLENREDVSLCVFIDRLELPANISILDERGWVETEVLGEVNSSSPDTLASFIEYALTEPTLQSDNFMLMVQNHGNGYLGLCSDEGLPDSEQPKVWMSIDDLGEGVRNGIERAGKGIDVISLDACTLGTVEVAYELRGTASYLVASELAVPFDGQNYIALMEGFSEDADIEPVDLARKLVDDYAEWYSAPLHTYPALYPYMQDFAALSVIDLLALEPLADRFEAFAGAVLPKDPSLGKDLKTAAMSAFVALWMNNMGTWFYSDIRVMFSNLGQSIRDSHPTVAAVCDEIVAAADDAIVHDWASWRMRGRVTGLSVFVPPSVGIFEQNWDSFGRAYDSVGLDFVSETGWDAVLLEYFYSVKMYG